MKGYILLALRSTVSICEMGGHCFIGNHSQKIFKTKKEVQEFKKSEEFKELDAMFPLEWHTQTVEVQNDRKE